MGLFGGKKPPSRLAYEEAHRVTLDFYSAIGYLRGRLFRHGGLQKRTYEVLQWIPSTADSLLLSMLTTESTFKQQIDSGLVKPAPRPAAALLLADLCAFVGWTGFEYADAAWDLLGTHVTSKERGSLLDQLSRTWPADPGATDSFAKRISAYRDSLATMVASDDKALEQVGSCGGILLARCMVQMRVGNPQSFDDSYMPLQEFIASAISLAQIVNGAGTRPQSLAAR